MDPRQQGQERGHERVAWAAERDLHLARGPVVGMVLLVVAAFLAIFLLRGPDAGW